MAAHFSRLGTNLGLNAKQVAKVFERFDGFRKIAEDWVDRSFLSDEFREKYIELLNQRYNILYR